MEDGLRAIFLGTDGYKLKSLNPCFNGRWSARRYWAKQLRDADLAVLILVLMEDGLRELGIFGQDYL